MLVSEKEFKEMHIEVDGCVFTPVVNLIEEFKDEVVKEPDGKYTTQKKPVFKYEVLKTAEEVYKEYLDCKDAPVVEEPSTEEKLKLLEDDNATLLFDLANKDVRLNQLENDFAELLLNLGGDK